MGADIAEKEIDEKIFEVASVDVDVFTQASTVGETRSAIRANIKSIYNLEESYYEVKSLYIKFICKIH
ncbi:hypothetical protein GCM10011384_18470 [Psychrobacillus lasiicapitis]|nr:hypothetical protein GCM10011384_18470 [Psychrobacillus lasiicapitis]